MAATAVAETVSAAQLRERLDRFPRAPLADLPTPLHECPRLAEAVGVRRFFVKRDDLTGLAFGGNKTRKFALSFADALAQGCDSVITGAASQSNHARQAAAAAAKLGLQAYLVNRHDHRSQQGIQGNHLLDCILGAEVRLADGVDQGKVKEQLAAELRAQGRKPYLIGHHAAVLGAVAYVECAVEIQQQLQAHGVEATRITLCSASGTQAGVALGVKALGMEARVIGFTPGLGDEVRRREGIANLANEAAELMGLGVRLSPDEVHNTHAYVGESYGIVTKAGLDAIELVARTEGILLDPVYTGKAMSGVIDRARTGVIPADATVVFVHTGGVPALFAYAPELIAHGGYEVRVVNDLARGVL